MHAMREPYGFIGSLRDIFFRTQECLKRQRSLLASFDVRSSLLLGAMHRPCTPSREPYEPTDLLRKVVFRTQECLKRHRFPFGFFECCDPACCLALRAGLWDSHCTFDPSSPRLTTVWRPTLFFSLQWSKTWVFVLNFVAIIPLANLLGTATEVINAPLLPLLLFALLFVSHVA